jgi:hypothetical protein
MENRHIGLAGGRQVCESWNPVALIEDNPQSGDFAAGPAACGVAF